jgi:hypothetical protein
MKTVRMRYNRCLLLIHFLSVANFLFRNDFSEKTVGVFFRNKVHDTFAYL